MNMNSNPLLMTLRLPRLLLESDNLYLSFIAVSMMMFPMMMH